MQNAKEYSPSVRMELIGDTVPLLAFSHGLDSTALFHLLREEGVMADLALVNYGVRPESEKEMMAARELARNYGVRIFVAHAPRWESGFECRARAFRYAFFEKLIERHGYETLLTAHQLNDRMEWMLMRLGRGAGAVELAGMRAEEWRRTSGGVGYRLVRPLLELPRDSLREYLEKRGERYFLDASNHNASNERGRLRDFCDLFVRQYASGVMRSFDYLEMDRERIRRDWELRERRGDLRILLLRDSAAASRAADSVLKESGYLLSAAERGRIDAGESLVAGRYWAVERSGMRLYIAPYRQGLRLPRRYREACRRAKIPPKIRPYCYEQGLDPSVLKEK